MWQLLFTISLRDSTEDFKIDVQIMLFDKSLLRKECIPFEKWDYICNFIKSCVFTLFFFLVIISPKYSKSSAFHTTCLLPIANAYVSVSHYSSILSFSTSTWLYSCVSSFPLCSMPVQLYESTTSIYIYIYIYDKQSFKMGSLFIMWKYDPDVMLKVFLII